MNSGHTSCQWCSQLRIQSIWLSPPTGLFVGDFLSMCASASVPAPIDRCSPSVVVVAHSRIDVCPRWRSPCAPTSLPNRSLRSMSSRSARPS